MRIIDTHVHTLDNFAPMAPFEDMGRVDRLLHHMDEAGVDKALMQTRLVVTIQLLRHRGGSYDLARRQCA